MAPIKFDNNIKNKLEKRTIQPSSDAWNTLSNRLNLEDKKNSRHLFFYIGIAASIVGVLFVSTLFIKSSEERSVAPTVVDTEVIEDIDKSKTGVQSNNKETRITTSKEDQILSNKKENVLITPIPSPIKNAPTVAISSKEKIIDTSKENTTSKNEPKASVASVNSLETSIKEVNALQKLSFEDAKTIEVVTQIKTLELQKGSVTEAEIEDLLKQAEKDILRQRIYDETTRTVDADALLQDVEADLEQSFRTRVFEALKSHSKSVLTAVTGRIK